ncbi:MAG: hypothetical protein R3E58_17275 [Phycisphaerae bacterium]|nr:hypothetical protein [Phycisphaerales bacterium]
MLKRSQQLGAVASDDVIGGFANDNGSQVNWLALDCAAIGQLVRESAHRRVANHLCESVASGCADREVNI